MAPYKLDGTAIAQVKMNRVEKTKWIKVDELSVQSAWLKTLYDLIDELNCKCQTFMEEKGVDIIKLSIKLIANPIAIR